MLPVNALVLYLLFFGEHTSYILALYFNVIGPMGKQNAKTSQASPSCEHLRSDKRELVSKQTQENGKINKIHTAAQIIDVIGTDRETTTLILVGTSYP